MPTKIYIEEYASFERDGKGNVIGPGRLLSSSNVSVGVASAQSSAFSDATQVLIVESDVACQFEVGDNPTAGSASQYLSPNNRKLVPVPKNKTGNLLKLAVIEQQ